METENKQLSFPYVSYPTLKAFIEHLHDTVVTEQIDNSMMPQSMSGSARASVTSTLKSLGLIDAQNNTTQKLKDLAKAYDTKEWPDAVKKNILSAYSGIIGSVDLKSVTRKQIDDLFADITPLVKDKCIRFFLSANKEAGVDYSPHLKIRRRLATKHIGKIPKSEAVLHNKDNPPDKINTEEKTPSGMFDQPIPIAASERCYIRVPLNITVSQFAMVKAVLAVIEEMAKQNEGSKQ
jgi:hypothetical protein